MMLLMVGYAAVGVGLAQHQFDTKKRSCDLSPGKIDGFVLALSWQNGFCQTAHDQSELPECLSLTKNSYAATHFSLHGLWPNQNACGISYNFCNSEEKPNFCDYKPLDLSPKVSRQLKILMPSYAAGSCLARHEWYKHGTCQLKDQDSYFSEAIVLANAINKSKFAIFVANHAGKKVSIVAFKHHFDGSFGDGTRKKIRLLCINGKLRDLYINLPAINSTTKKLTVLLKTAKNALPDKCPSQFHIPH